MSINTEYLKSMSTPELLDALTHRRRMANAYRAGSGIEIEWAEHHESVVAAIEAEMARRARDGVSA